jgi:DNA polymerase zeta
MATMLRAGSILNTSFRVHEGHLGYILQFLCDFGLYGCGWLEIGEASLRGEVEGDLDQPDLCYWCSTLYSQMSRDSIILYFRSPHWPNLPDLSWNSMHPHIKS